MDEIKIELPWAPSLNSYKKIGRIVQTKSGKLYQQRVNNNDTKAFYFETWVRCKRLHGGEGTIFYHSDTIMLEVVLCLHPPPSTASKRWDLDNRIKVTLDGLMHGRLIKDDSQIHRLIVRKCESIENGQVIVAIKEFTG